MMKLLYAFLREAQALATLAVVGALVSGVASTAVIWVIHQAMETEGASHGHLILSFVGLCLLVIAAQMVSELVLLRLSEGTVFKLRIQLARRILRTPLLQLENLGAHRLLATISTDVRTVAGAVTLSPLFSMYAGTLAACVAYMAYLDWRIFLILQPFSMVVLGPYWLAARQGEKLLGRAREDNDSVYNALRGLSEGTKELKLNHDRRQAFLGDVLGTPAESVRKNNVAGYLCYRIAGIFGRIFFLVGLGILLFVVPLLIDVPQNVINGFVVVLLYMNMPMTGLLNIMPAFGTARVAMRKIDSLGLSLTATEAAAEASPPPPARWQTLELVGTTHTYIREGEDGTFTLGPIDLTLNRGEILFLVGGNGSGKTTLAKLLVGLYTPESGEIRIDGKVVDPKDHEAYRSHFAMVFTDFFLFEKILGFRDEGIDERAQTYIEKLLLRNKVKVTDGRLSTTDLSQGQRKRLALLNAYLEDRPIYVFDEWAADQDPTFKEIFYFQLLPELKERGKAVVVISHDDHYYQAADRIVKLDYGTVDSQYTPASRGVETTRTLGLSGAQPQSG